jgi:N-acetylmuramoyl-L-alanine amidase
MGDPDQSSMSRSRMKLSFRALVVFLPLSALLAVWWLARPDSSPVRDKEPLPPPVHPLAELGQKPDWSQLARFQNTISAPTLLNRLENIYTKNGSWKEWVSVHPTKNEATIGRFTLKLTKTDLPAPGSIYRWKKRADLDPKRDLPLSGLKIAIDPGHIGGAYAALEGREHRWGKLVIQEGTMTLATARKLVPLLEKLGASVSLVRSQLEPVTGKRARDFAEPRLFFRTSEIRARARLVNELIQPDLVVCLHFNGSSSKVPEVRQHFHIILNGTYTREELSHEDERFEMFQRLLSGTITEEIPLARNVAAAFNEMINLPPYQYPLKSRTSQRLDHHPNLWARNLLANRLYQCPVIFLEPYVMNSIPFISRYRKNPDEIYLEYARAVAEGLARYYSRP